MAVTKSPLPLVLVGEHHRHDPAGEGRVRRVRGEVQEIEVVIIDLEEHDMAIDLHRPKVVLPVGVVVAREAVKAGDGAVDTLDGLGAERLDATGDDDATTAMVLAKLVVEEADLLSFLGHRSVRSKL